MTARRKLSAVSRRLNRVLRAIRHEPVILRATGALRVGSRPLTFVVVCGPAFDQRIPNAGVTSRLGWCAGFEQLDIPYQLVSVKSVAQLLPTVPDPICFVSATDYAYLDDAALTTLKRYRTMVWVDTWFRGESVYRAERDLPENTLKQETRERVLAAAPALLFTISPERSFEFYELWFGHDVPLVSLPLACDTSRYPLNPPHNARFENVEMAFVGGYWPYKARQLDRYLRPYENRLTVFGYSAWPYAGYGGLLAAEDEASLYRQAVLSPCINEPHVELMGVDINERIFKILGSGGVSITDAVPAYRDWFGPNELLVPTSLEEFHDMAVKIFSDSGFREQLRAEGSAAVLQRHTYAHRASRALELLTGTPAVWKPQTA